MLNFKILQVLKKYATDPKGCDLQGWNASSKNAVSEVKVLIGEIPAPREEENIARLKAVAQSYWERFPEFLALCTELSVLEEVTPKQAIQTLGLIVQFIGKAKKPGFSPQTCPVLLFHSAYKPSYWPAMSLLADRLVHKGFACALVSNDYMEIRRPASPGAIAVESVPGFHFLKKYGFGQLQALKVVLHALWATLILFWLSFKRDRQVLKNLLQDPVKVWFYLTMSKHRFALSRYLLNSLQPRLMLVNHERVPIGAELIMSPAAAHTLRVQICNEPPYSMILPFLSDEVWVWNEMAARLVEETKPGGLTPKTEVIGSNEVDVALQPPEASREAETILREKTGGKPILLLLSEYYPGVFYDPHERPLSQKVMSWLEEAARQCPEWYFILKPRQHKLGQRPPGTKFLEELPNFSVADYKIPYRQYLNWDNVLAVAAVGSTGLFAAAGAGKTAIRLAVTPNRYCWPVIEDVSVVVNSPEEFVQVLKRLTTNSKLGALCSDENRRFPYRGHTVERMEQLCLERLLRKGERGK